MEVSADAAIHAFIDKNEKRVNFFTLLSCLCALLKNLVLQKKIGLHNLHRLQFLLFYQRSRLHSCSRYTVVFFQWSTFRFLRNTGDRSGKTVLTCTRWILFCASLYTTLRRTLFVFLCRGTYFWMSASMALERQLHASMRPFLTLWV